MTHMDWRRARPQRDQARHDDYASHDGLGRRAARALRKWVRENGVEDLGLERWIKDGPEAQSKSRGGGHERPGRRLSGSMDVASTPGLRFLRATTTSS